MSNNIFKVTVNNKEIELRVIHPSGATLRNAQLEYARVWSQAVKGGAMLKAKLDDYLRAQNIWDDEKEEKYKNIVKVIIEGEKVLNSGNTKLRDAREIALNVSDARRELIELASQRIEMETNTAEGQAENSRFNYIVVECLVYNDTGKQYFKNVEDFIENSTSDAAVQGSHMLAEIYMGIDNSLEDKRVENRFLKKYKFIDDKGRLIDKDGNYVNRAGKRVDEEGRLLNEDGKPVTQSGDLIKTPEEVEAEFQPFLDDDGNPILD